MCCFRQTAISVFIGGLIATAAPVAASEFEGGGFISQFEDCDSQGWAGVLSVTARFRPAGLPGNEPAFHSLVFQLGQGTHVYRFAATDPVGQWAEAEAWLIWSGAPSQVIGPEVRVRIIGWASQLSDEDDSDTIRLHGRIENFNGLAGCHARFGLSMQARG